MILCAGVPAIWKTKCTGHPLNEYDPIHPRAHVFLPGVGRQGQGNGHGRGARHDRRQQRRKGGAVDQDHKGSSGCRRCPERARRQEFARKERPWQGRGQGRPDRDARPVSGGVAGVEIFDRGVERSSVAKKKKMLKCSVCRPTDTRNAPRRCGERPWRAARRSWEPWHRSRAPGWPC